MQTRSGSKYMREKVDSPAPIPKYKSNDPTLIKARKDKCVDADLTQEDIGDVVIRATKRKRAPQKDAPVEKRLRTFRDHPPLSYLQRLDRALSQRMCVLSRTRGGTDNDPEEIVELAGTTGNIYHVIISKLPSCTCPDSTKGNQCKHIIYILKNVLKAPPNLQYQRALTSSELVLIFASAPIPPPIPLESATPNKRKEIEGACPICFTDFSPETEEIVWCKASCGQNVHKDCFEQWAKSKKRKDVGCVYCRAPWESDKDVVDKAREGGRVNNEGYVNVGLQLGMSRVRDYSTYHQPWVRRNYHAIDYGFT